MKAFVALAAVLACASASPQYIAYNGVYGAPGLTYSAGLAGPVVYSAPVLASAPVIAPAFTKTQYHAQDELGQASYGYAHPGQAHAAVRDAFGGVRGSYAYVDPNGKEVRVNYVADAVNGFRVESNALPEAPVVPAAPALIAPVPVVDTPEVAQAKAEHAKAVEEAKARNAEAEKTDAVEAAPAQSRRKRSLVYSVAAPVVASPLTYSVAAPVVASPLSYSVGVPALTYSAYSPVSVVAAQPVREATLTKVINTPGHAVSYRVD